MGLEDAVHWHWHAGSELCTLTLGRREVGREQEPAARGFFLTVNINELDDACMNHDARLGPLHQLDMIVFGV